MDTEKLFFVESDKLDQKMQPKLNQEEVKLVDEFLALNQRIIDNLQLLDIVDFDLAVLRNCFEFKSNDTFIRKKNCPDEFNDAVSINALVISFLGACKTLLSSIEDIKFPDKDYKKLFNDTFDNYFSYRLMYHMRHFSQHGYLPISMDNGKMCFDVYQILDTKHFNFNKKLKQELNKINEEIIKEKHDRPNLFVTIPLAEYNIVVHELFMEYLKNEKTEIIKQINIVLPIIEKYNLQDVDAFIYKECDGIKHGCPTKIDSETFLQKTISELKNNIENEKHILKNLKNGIRVLY